MNVVFLSPAYPPEMQQFTRGLHEVGVSVFGVGDTPRGALPPALRARLTDYLQVPAIMDEADVTARIDAWLRGRSIDRVETNWEPLTLLAARLRERYGLPGLRYDTVLGFRDKVLMRQRVEAAGLRIPKTRRVRTPQEARAAAAEIGFPLIIKPVAGAGSADTWRVDDAATLESVLARTSHVAEASVEEFITGDEYTYETICIDGVPVIESVTLYLPNVLDARKNEWISPIIISVRDMSRPEIQPGIQLGRSVLKALGMGTGFTHMEWYRTASGEAVFGEIACRSPGACMVDLMNYTCDIDLFREWGRAVSHGSFAASTTRKYNAAIIFKRAIGQGRIRHIQGIESFRARFGHWIAREDLLPIGAPRRDWNQTFLSDGHLVVRHPDWDRALQMARAATTDITLFAGA